MILNEKRIEKIENLEQKIQELTERKKLEEKKLKEQSRRNRTQRLIKVGSITEKILMVEGEEKVREKLEEMKVLLNQTKQFFGATDINSLEILLKKEGDDDGEY